jgi:hypothetical protein
MVAVLPCGLVSLLCQPEREQRYIRGGMKRTYVLYHMQDSYGYGPVFFVVLNYSNCNWNVDLETHWSMLYYAVEDSFLYWLNGKSRVWQGHKFLISVTGQLPDW